MTDLLPQEEEGTSVDGTLDRPTSRVCEIDPVDLADDGDVAQPLFQKQAVAVVGNVKVAKKLKGIRKK